MARKKPIISPFGQWAYPGEVTIIPSSDITMKGVNYPVLGIDNLGNQQMMMPGGEYTFPGDYVTEIPQMGKGGLRQWFAEEWTDVKTGKPCGRSGKDKDGRPYPACRPSKRVNETTPKTTSEMSSAEKAKFKREKTSGKRIDYNHKRREFGGESWLDQYQDGSQVPFSDSSNYSYDKDGNLIYTADWRNYTNDIITNNIYSLINNPTKENSVIKKGFFRQGQPNSKSRDLNNDEIEFLKRTLQQFEDPEADFKGDVSTKVDKLNPSLDELIKVTQNIYPDQYAIDNSFLKASKSDSKINLPISAFENDIKERYVIPEVLKNSINKSFGTLPTTQEEGYSPNRIWTTKVKNNEKSGVGAGFTKPGDYAYVLTPNSKEISGLSKDQIDNQKKITERSLSSINDEFYKNLYDEGRGFVQYPGDYNNPDISLYGNLTQYLPNQIWNRAEQMRVEMMNNPEIKAWSDLHNINLLRDTSNEINKNDLTDDGFAVKVPESMYANRLVKAGLPVSTPDYNYGDNDTYIAQDPSKFNLAGYFPIPEGYNDENAKELIAKKLGIKPEQLNNKDYLIHYNKTPITEYTPGKKYGGWLDQFQTGGSFTNLLKLAMTPEVRGIVANQLVDKGVTKVAQKVGDSSKQQIFDRYRPVDYPDVIGAIFNSGKDIPLRDLQGDYHVSEEAWRLALGLPTKSKYISPSKYRPTKASDPNAQYYSLNNVYDPQKLIDAYIQKAQGKPGQTVQMDALSPYIINQDMMTTDNEIPFTQTDPLQKFSLSQGEDERGRYISIYDKYDFNVPYMDDVVYGSNRKPYEFYDRFYYKKDAAGKPVYVKQKKQGGQTSWLNKYK